MIEIFDLERFLTAQGLVFDNALAELRMGSKRSHWMWFIFPQLRGLGHSFRAQFYGLTSVGEAKAYLAHPILGERLEACTRAVLDHGDQSLHAIFGSPDDLKFQSSMTVFAQAAGERDIPFQTALNHWFSGNGDAQTLALLAEADTVD